MEDQDERGLVPSPLERVIDHLLLAREAANSVGDPFLTFKIDLVLRYTSVIAEVDTERIPLEDLQFVGS